ncbi:hypothetical protein [Spartinivicinus marinus]|nr:hypothetical protein [Spartinivicinus marinus]
MRMIIIIMDAEMNKQSWQQHWIDKYWIAITTIIAIALCYGLLALI